MRVLRGRPSLTRVKRKEERAGKRAASVSSTVLMCRSSIAAHRSRRARPGKLLSLRPRRHSPLGACSAQPGPHAGLQAGSASRDGAGGGHIISAIVLVRLYGVAPSLTGVNERERRVRFLSWGGAAQTVRRRRKRPQQRPSLRSEHSSLTGHPVDVLLLLEVLG